MRGRIWEWEPNMIVDFVLPDTHSGDPFRSWHISHLSCCGVFQLFHGSAKVYLLHSTQPDPLLPFAARLKASSSARQVCQCLLPNDFYFEEQDVFDMIAKTKWKSQRDRDYEEYKNYQTKIPIPYTYTWLGVRNWWWKQGNAILMTANPSVTCSAPTL